MMTGERRLDPAHDAVEHAAKMLAALGIVGDERTPLRLVWALDELTRHRGDDPARHLGVRFPPVRQYADNSAGQPALVVVTDVPFVSVCEHHVLPFTGIATVAYLPAPGDHIVGLSKLARLVQEYAARPQVQERLTDQVVTAIMGELTPRGAACAVRGHHTCMGLRGARAGAEARMVTVQYAGSLHVDPWRREFRGYLGTPAWRD